MLLQDREVQAVAMLSRGETHKAVSRATRLPISHIVRLRDEVGLPALRSWSSIKQRRDLAVDAYKGGMPKNEVLKVYRIDQRILYKELKRRGIRLRNMPPCVLCPAQIEQITHYRRKGKTWMYICFMLRLKWTTRVVSETYRAAMTNATRADTPKHK